MFILSNILFAYLFSVTNYTNRNNSVLLKKTLENKFYAVYQNCARHPGVFLEGNFIELEYFST